MQPELAQRYGVQGIPYFVVFRNGSIVHQQSGVARRDQIEQWLDAAG